MQKFQKTNDNRLIGHLSKIFGVPACDTISGMLDIIDLARPNLPVSFKDIVIVYETFPVFGELTFPKGKSHLWQLLDSTEAPMLLTDAMISGKEGLFICQSFCPTVIESELCRVIALQSSPAIQVNTYRGVSALAYPLISL